jgi:hypothetical protein
MRRFQANEQLSTRHYVDRLSFGERWYGGGAMHSIRLCLIGPNIIASEGENDGLVFLGTGVNHRFTLSMPSLRISGKQLRLWLGLVIAV